MGINTINYENLEIFRDTKVVIFGSIGSIAETSELQLQAFNRAFKEFNLDWEWTHLQYKSMLVEPGGKKRIQRFSDSVTAGLSETDIERLYELKGNFFLELLAMSKILLRPGVKDMMLQCVSAGVRLAWVTTTSEQNISAIQTALKGQIDFDLFQLITNNNYSVKPKPSSEIYDEAIRLLDFKASKCIAIEDSTSGITASKGAGIYSIAYPGEFLKTHDFSLADICVSNLSYISLVSK